MHRQCGLQVRYLDIRIKGPSDARVIAITGN